MAPGISRAPGCCQRPPFSVVRVGRVLAYLELVLAQGHQLS